MPVHADPEDGHRIVERVANEPVTAASRLAAGEGEHSSENAPAHLERSLDLVQVRAQHVWFDQSRPQVLLNLLHERQDRPESVVHIVRNAAGKLRHCVFALRLQHPRLQGFGSLRVLDRDGGLRAEALDQLGVVPAEGARVAGSDLQHAENPVACGKRGDDHRPLAQSGSLSLAES